MSSAEQSSLRATLADFYRGLYCQALPATKCDVEVSLASASILAEISVITTGEAATDAVVVTAIAPPLAATAGLNVVEVSTVSAAAVTEVVLEQAPSGAPTASPSALPTRAPIATPAAPPLPPPPVDILGSDAAATAGGDGGSGGGGFTFAIVGALCGAVALLVCIGGIAVRRRRLDPEKRERSWSREALDFLFRGKKKAARTASDAQLAHVKVDISETAAASDRGIRWHEPAKQSPGRDPPPGRVSSPARLSEAEGLPLSLPPRGVSFPSGAPEEEFSEAADALLNPDLPLPKDSRWQFRGMERGGVPVAFSPPADSLPRTTSLPPMHRPELVPAPLFSSLSETHATEESVERLHAQRDVLRPQSMPAGRGERSSECSTPPRGGITPSAGGDAGPVSAVKEEAAAWNSKRRALLDAAEPAAPAPGGLELDAYTFLHQERWVRQMLTTDLSPAENETIRTQERWLEGAMEASGISP